MMTLNSRVLRCVALSVVAAVLSVGEPLVPSHAASPIPSVLFVAFYTETYVLPPCMPLVCTYPGRGTGFTSATGSMTETTALTLMPSPSSACQLAQAKTTFTGIVTLAGRESATAAPAHALPR
jgi:hypothetical protein